MTEETLVPAFSWLYSLPEIGVQVGGAGRVGLAGSDDGVTVSDDAAIFFLFADGVAGEPAGSFALATEAEGFELL